MTTLIVIKDFVVKHKEYFLFLVLFVLGALAVAKGINFIIEKDNEHKVAALEKVVSDNEKHIQQIEGQKILLQAELDKVRGELTESNTRVHDAENQTTQIKTVYVTTKGKGPTFNSKDEEGQVRELTTVVNSLYP